MSGKSHSIIRRHILLALFSVVAAFIGVQIYKYNKLYAQAWDVPSFQTAGDETAEVTVMEFTDYNCPYCRKIHPVIREVLDVATDIHYIARPIGALGPQSEEFAKIALAAGKQDKFWEFHNAFLSRTGPIHDGFIEKLANDNNIDLRQLYADIESEEIQNYFNKNTQSASVLGISYIPALMINKTLYVPSDEEATAADILRAIKRATR